MREENWKTKIIGQIHDSIILDVHPDELGYVIEVARDVTTKQLPEEWKWIIVPLVIDIEKYEKNENWGAKTVSV